MGKISIFATFVDGSRQLVMTKTTHGPGTALAAVTASEIERAMKAHLEEMDEDRRKTYDHPLIQDLCADPLYTPKGRALKPRKVLGPFKDHLSVKGSIVGHGSRDKSTGIAHVLSEDAEGNPLTLRAIVISQHGKTREYDIPIAAA